MCPSPSYTYTLTNGTTADASQVMQDFNDILNGVTDGTKDLSISALTVAGTATFNGNVNLGNASGDDLSITASLASSIPIKTNNSYDIGSATLGLRKLYLGNGGAGATCDIISASHAATREYTVPDCSAAASFVMTEATQTINGTKTFAGQLIGKGTATNDSASTGYIGEYTESTASLTNFPASDTPGNVTTLTVTAGDWDLYGGIVYIKNGATLAAEIEVLAGISSNTSSFTGTQLGQSSLRGQFIAAAENDDGHSIGGLFRRVSVSAATASFYLTTQATYSAGSPQVAGAIWGRRVR